MDVRSRSSADSSPSVLSYAGSAVVDAPRQALEQFRQYGDYLNRGGSIGQQIVDAMSLPAGAGGIADDAIKLTAKLARPLGLESPQEFGFIGKGVAKLGNLCDAVLGVGELAQAYAKDREGTDFASRMNVGFLGKTVEVTARIGAANTVGYLVAAGAMAVSGATVLPIVAGVAAGAGAAYVVGKAADMIRGLF